MSNPVIILDADPAVYAAAFAAQSSSYHVVYETKGGEMKQKIWNDGNVKNKFFRRFPSCQIMDEEKVIQTETASHARQACKTIFDRMISKIAKEFNTHKGGIDLEVYLTGSNNFRYELAQITPYKAGRPDKPAHYQTVRDYILDVWNGIVIEDWEADDEVSIRCRQLTADGRTPILATIDKDLDQVPCAHYDYRRHVFYDIDERYADLFFWQQVLSGDSTDTIQGIPKIGSGKAGKMIAEWSDECHEMEISDQWESYVWERIVTAYAVAMEKFPDKFPEGMTAEEAAIENARLVKMMDYHGQLWTPPGVPDKEIQQ